MNVYMVNKPYMVKSKYDEICLRLNWESKTYGYKTIYSKAIIYDKEWDLVAIY